jgi:indole-3-glycerol phosphate synthase
MILDDIVARKRERLAATRSKSILAELENSVTLASKPRDFLAALKQGGRPAVIAEIKKASPSAGEFRANLDVREVAVSYERAGAAAISVITEEDFFQGKLRYLEQARQAVSLPVMCKDFILDRVQILAARAAGADGLLLIAAILKQAQLVELLALARTLGMACLVEVHEEQELMRVLETDAVLIGINNRDLRTFKVSLDTTVRLRPLIPSDRLVVSESGIQDREDLKSLAAVGIEAVLVGTSLMRAKDPGAKLRELLGRA